jgi:hypothetical protein
VAFTYADSPELLKGCSPLEYLTENIYSLSLLFQARIVFFGIVMSLVSSIFANTARFSVRSREEREGKHCFL